MNYLKIPLYLLRFAVSYIWFKATVSQSQKVFLIGSNYGNGADENAISMYNYINSQGLKAYIVSNRPADGEIARGSMKCFYLYFCCTSVYYTHSFSDILPYMHRAPSLLDLAPSPCRVFIQHGVIGLKNRNCKISIRDYVLSLNDSFDYMLASSQWEKDLIGSFGIDKKKILVTGLPRFDTLLQCSFSRKNVMIFLTWQDYDVYKYKLNDILSVIRQKIDNKDIGKVVIRHHPMMRLEENEKESIQETICRCSLLITDDSSVAWDFFYKKGKVLFYQPSQWLIGHSGMRNIITYDRPSLSRKVSRYIKGELQHNSCKFAFVDDNNCKRVYESTALR